MIEIGPAVFTHRDAFLLDAIVDKNTLVGEGLVGVLRFECEGAVEVDVLMTRKDFDWVPVFVTECLTWPSVSVEETEDLKLMKFKFGVLKVETGMFYLTRIWRAK